MKMQRPLEIVQYLIVKLPSLREVLHTEAYTF